MRDFFEERRAIMGGLGLAAAGALALPGRARAADGAAPWSPTLEVEDAWLDKAGTRHRLVLDVTSAPAAASAVFYADTYYEANRTGYSLAPEVLAVVLVLRHFATPFGYNDVIWAKYGALLADKLKLEGDQAIRAARVNPLLSAAAKPGGRKGDGEAPVSLSTLAAKGARFGVCGVATAGIAAQLAKASGGGADAVERELKANLVPGAVLSAAGIVAINRAQEHGYAFAYIAD